MSISSNKTTRLYILGTLISLLALGAVFWANYRFATQNPGGNDFLPRWVGTQAFIYKGWSPYSEETGAEIQNLIYGRNAVEGEDQSLFIYPFYSTLIFSPFALIFDYSVARALWMTFLELCLIAIAILPLRLVDWRMSTWLLGPYFFFAIFWYHGLRSIINGNTVVVVTLLLVLSLKAIREKKDVVAGFFLAYATIKPNLAILLIAFLFVWSFSHRRWSLMGWFTGWFLFLIVLGMFFIPNWVLQDIWAIIRYPSYTTVGALGSVIEGWLPGVGLQLKWGLTIFLALLLGVEWWSAWGKGFTHALWTACLTLAVSQWIGITTDPGNFTILFVPLILILAVLKERWGKRGDWMVLGVLVGLFAGLWFLFLNTVEYGVQPQQNPVMFIPMPLFVLAGLYWVRWWFIRPTRKILAS